MATIKVKLRPSSVVGRAGTIFYQVTHRRATQQITTNIRLQPNEWDAMREQVAVSVADRSIVLFVNKKVYMRFVGTHEEYSKIKDIKNI